MSGLPSVLYACPVCADRAFCWTSLVACRGHLEFGCATIVPACLQYILPRVCNQELSIRSSALCVALRKESIQGTIPVSDSEVCCS